MLRPTRTKVKVQSCSYTYIRIQNTPLSLALRTKLHLYWNSFTTVAKFSQPALRPAKLMAVFTHIPVWKRQYLQRYASEPGNFRRPHRKLMVCDRHSSYRMFIITISLHSIIQAKNALCVWLNKHCVYLRGYIWLCELPHTLKHL